MAYKGKKKKKRQPSFFKWTTLILLAAFVLLALVFPGLDHEVGVLTDRYKEINTEYLAAQDTLKGLKESLDHVNDTAVIERLARRNSDCGWIGEIIYEVENLDSVRSVLYGSNDDKAED